MSVKQKMCKVVDRPTSILASLFAALMFTGIHNQSSLSAIFKSYVIPVNLSDS